MSNIIPPSINDKLNNMMDYIKYLYKAFVSFTQNFYVDPSQNIIIKAESLQIKINDNQIIDIDNTGNVDISGTTINLNDKITIDGSGNVDISGTSININGTMDISANYMNFINNNANIVGQTINVQGSHLNLTSGSNEILINTIIDNNPSMVFGLYYANGSPSTTNFNIGSLHIDYTNGLLYILTNPSAPEWKKVAFVT